MMESKDVRRIAIRRWMMFLAAGAWGLVACLVSVPASAQAPASPAQPPGDLAKLGNLGPAQQNKERAWTIVAYLCANNNLEAEILDDLNELEAGLPARGVEVIALIDRADQYDTSDGNWTDARVYRVKADTELRRLNSDLLAQPGELNLGDAAVLETFLQAALRTFPAKQYALVIAGHGQGWGGLAGDEQAPGGAAVKGAAPIDEVRTAIRKALDAAHVPTLDLVVLDCCLMGQLEVAVELADVATVVVASEASVPGAGCPWDKIVPAFSGQSDPVAIGRQAVRHFGEYYDRQEDHRSTMSAIDTRRLPDLVKALDALFAKIQPKAQEEWAGLCRSMYFAESYAGRLDFLRGPSALATIDLLDCLGRMRTALKAYPADAELDKVRRAFAAAVPASYQGQARRLSHGLAIHAPVRSDILRPAYGRLRFCREGRWPNLIAEIHTAQNRELTPPEVPLIEIIDRDGRVTRKPWVAGNCSFRFVVRGNHLLWVTMEHARLEADGQGMIFLGRSFVFDLKYDQRRLEAIKQAADLIDTVIPQYADGRNVLTEPLTGLTLQVSDGRRRFEATVDFSDPSDLRHCRVPALYEHPLVGKQRVDIYFDANWLTARHVVAVTKSADGTVTLRPIEPRPEAKVTPLCEKMSAGRKDLEYVASGETVWGRGLRLVPALLEPGDYCSAVTAVSLAGEPTMKVAGYQLQANPAFVRLLALTQPFQARDLVGEWAWELGQWNPLRQDYDFRPSKVRLNLKASQERPGALDYTLKGQVGDKPVDLAGFVLVEGGEVPNLKFFTKVNVQDHPLLFTYLRPEDAGHARTDFYVAFYFKEGGKHALFLWDPYQGIVLRAYPPDQPIVQASDLVGTWRSADGTITLVVTEVQFQTWVGALLFDAGIWKIQGNQLISTNTRAVTTVQTFDLKGNTLTLTNADGVRTVLMRVR